MTMRRSTRLVAASLAAAVLVGLFPAAASAQAPVAGVVLYEVWEALELRGQIKTADPEAFRRRFAEAGLLGLKPTAPPSGVFGEADGIVAEATSNVNVAPGNQQFGTGPIRGDFQLLRFMGPQIRGSDPNLAQLVVTAEGRLQGTLDLRLALDPQMPIPLAPVAGTWQLKGAGGRPGRFEGAFLIPVSVPTVAGPLTFYIVPGVLLKQAANPFGVACNSPVPAEALEPFLTLPPTAAACQLEPEEFVLGFALTKAVIVLFE